MKFKQLEDTQPMCLRLVVDLFTYLIVFFYYSVKSKIKESAVAFLRLLTEVWIDMLFLVMLYMLNSPLSS